MKVNRVDMAWFLREIHGVDIPENRLQYKLRCPFHDDRNPSACVYLDTQRFMCYSGGCFNSRAVDVLDILQETENLSFLEAVELTKSWPGTLVDMADSSGPSKSQRNKRAAKKKFAFKILGE